MTFERPSLPTGFEKAKDDIRFMNPPETPEQAAELSARIQNHILYFPEIASYLSDWQNEMLYQNSKNQHSTVSQRLEGDYAT